MFYRLTLLVAMFAVATIDAAGLVDYSITADSIQYLDSEEWTATSDLGTIRAKVPGDLITDLQNAGMMGDPLYELNWLKYQDMWDKHVWTYAVTFAVDMQSLSTGTSVVLVFDGIKMSSTVQLNGVYLLNTTNQFLRYITSPIDHSILKAQGNVLTVTFDSSVQTTEGRFMACTGGWDWAPYSTSVTNGMGADGPTSTRTLSKGIWKSVYLAYVSNVAVTDVVPLVFYQGPFPIAPLSRQTVGDFQVQVRLHFWAPMATNGTVQVIGSWSTGTLSENVVLPAGESNYTLTLGAAAGSVDLWWPSGAGAQPLYDVTAIFIPTSGQKLTTAPRQIGFRFVALVTGNDTDPAWVKANENVDGSANQGMLFRVNGAPIYARGANMIPIDNFEGRYSEMTLTQMVRSARDANFNFLRVWGGGVFLPFAFYEACDKLGIMVYHDMQFAQSGHSPSQSRSQSQLAEFRHQARRLSAHASVVIFDGCNECQVYLGTDTAVYANFVLQTVVEEDTSRIVWPSCPSMGWENGVSRLSAHPNGSPKGLVPSWPYPPASANQTCTFLTDTDVSNAQDTWQNTGTDPADCCQQCSQQSQCASVVHYEGTCWFKAATGTPYSRPGRTTCRVVSRPRPRATIEVHGPYWHGSGWPAVNGGNTIVTTHSGFPLAIDTGVQFGLTYQNLFTSEFGASVFSSFESMSPTLDPSHWSVHGGSAPDSCDNGFEKTCNGTNVMAQRNYPCDGTTIS